MKWRRYANDRDAIHFEPSEEVREQIQRGLIDAAGRRESYIVLEIGQRRRDVCGLHLPALDQQTLLQAAIAAITEATLQCPQSQAPTRVDWITSGQDLRDGQFAAEQPMGRFHRGLTNAAPSRSPLPAPRPEQSTAADRR